DPRCRPVRLCALGVQCDFSGPGAKPAVRRADADFQLATTQRPRVPDALKAIIQSCLALRQCPLLAQSGQASRVARCPLSGVKQTGLPDDALSAVDPKRT